MSGLIRLIGILALVLASAAGATDMVPVPPLKARVTDLTGTLAAGELAALEAELRAFELKKGSQIAVLLLPSTQPETIEQYSIRVAERWKIGRAKVDDGVILVIAKNDQRLRIEVGYGLEGVIPDVVAKRVIREVIAPHFLANDFYGGVRDGGRALMKLIEGEKLSPPANAQAKSSSADDYQSLFGILLVVVVVGGAVLKAALGRVVGSAATGVAAGFIAWSLAGVLGMAVIAGLLVFFVTLMGMGRGFIPGGLGGGGGFGGGGGSFGGGGASGGWGSK
ncbi:MAG: TPM domain-containing protein [Proteobacteria bacterium]|nr:TPM domain-containing protein [Pseudomonadota bacterium]